MRVQLGVVPVADIVTKADLFQRIEDLKADLAAAQAQARTAVDDRNTQREEHRAAWKARDPESVAIDRCVRALDDYCGKTNSTFSSSHKDVTRVLLFLAARYGASVQPTPAPDVADAVIARLSSLEYEAQMLRAQIGTSS